MIDWGLLLIALLASFAMTGLIRRLAIYKQVLDIPVDRSAHTIPTPLGGGVAIVIPFFVLVAYYYALEAIPFSHLLALMGGLAVSLSGLVDDLKTLGIRSRIGVQVVAAIWSVYWLGDAPTISVLAWTLQSSLLIKFLSVLALVWLLNLYNFMDGIDGLAAMQAVFVTVMTFLLIMFNDEGPLMVIVTALCAPAIGFLLWNWPPAKIFMGDVGSGFLGFILGICALISLQSGHMNIWAWMLLLGVFIVDATYTLIIRASRGERWYNGHNTHAYQHAARRFASHRKVTLGVLVINLLWLSPLAWLAVRFPATGVFIALLGLTPLLALARYFKSGVKVVFDGKG